MSDLEYDILDELYFLIHFNDLLINVNMSEEDIKPVINKLHRKGWIRCYTEPDKELTKEEVDIELYFRNYYYLASKDGLKAHTS